MSGAPDVLSIEGTLARHGLAEHGEALRKIGLKRVTDIGRLEAHDLEQLGIANRFDLAALTELISEVRITTPPPSTPGGDLLDDTLARHGLNEYGAALRKIGLKRVTDLKLLDAADLEQLHPPPSKFDLTAFADLIAEIRMLQPFHELLRRHQLGIWTERLLAVGVKRLVDLRALTPADYDRLKMGKHDRAQCVALLQQPEGAEQQDVVEEQLLVAGPRAPLATTRLAATSAASYSPSLCHTVSHTVVPPSPTPPPPMSPPPEPQPAPAPPQQRQRQKDTSREQAVAEKWNGSSVQELGRQDGSAIKISYNKPRHEEKPGQPAGKKSHLGVPSGAAQPHTKAAAPPPLVAVAVAVVEAAEPREMEAKRAVSGRGYTNTKGWVMLSYSWSAQKLVQRARKALSPHYRTWMDIDGGMAVDVYDSMAEGVQTAFAVVCFMNQAYQESENCRLELKFARQLGRPIVPVLLEPEPWRATGWLGIVTAGLLWVPLSDNESFDECIEAIATQIQRAAPEQFAGAGQHVMSADGGETEDELEVVPAEEVVAELSRLQRDLPPHDSDPQELFLGPQKYLLL